MPGPCHSQCVDRAQQSPQILLFIPTYNCERQLPRVLSQVDSEMMSFISGVLIVDNVSKDRTFAIAQEWVRSMANPLIVAHQNPVNLGFGGSHQFAFSKAIQEGRTHVLVLHGDDQATLRDFFPILSLKLPLGHIFGSRFSLRSRRLGYSSVKTLGNFFFCFISSLVTGRLISDFGGSGLNLYAMDPLKTGKTSVKFRDFPKDLAFHPFVLLAAISDSQPILFFPISWREEDQVSNVRAWRQGRFLLILLLKYFFKNASVLTTRGAGAPPAI